MKWNWLGMTLSDLKTLAAEHGLDLVPKSIAFDNGLLVDEALALAQANDRTRVAEGTAKVYFVQEDGIGAIKIGTSKHLKKRVDELARDLPSKVTLLATLDGWRDVELVIHLRFAHARIRGEWFRPVPELLSYIESIKAGALGQNVERVPV